MRKHTLNIEAHTNQWLMAEWNTRRWQAVFDIPNSVLRNSFQVSAEQVWPKSMDQVRKHFGEGGAAGEKVNSALRLSYRSETRVTRGPENSLHIDIYFFEKGVRKAFFIIKFYVSKDGEVISMWCGERMIA